MSCWFRHDRTQDSLAVLNNILQLNQWLILGIFQYYGNLIVHSRKNTYLLFSDNVQVIMRTCHRTVHSELWSNDDEIAEIKIGEVEPILISKLCSRHHLRSKVGTILMISPSPKSNPKIPKSQILRGKRDFGLWAVTKISSMKEVSTKKKISRVKMT